MAVSRGKAGAKPRRSAVEIEQKGLDAHGLAVEHRARLEDRLPPGAIDRLAEDLGSIGVVVPGALEARIERKGATASQYAAAEQAKELVMRMRASLASAKLAKASRVEFGEGTRVSPKVVKSVVAAGEQILKRAEENPEDLRAAGIVERDIVKLRAAIEGARAADRRQETRKKAQREATASRDATLVRIEALVKRVATAGALEFIDEPDVKRRFDALLAPMKAKKPEPTGV